MIDDNEIDERLVNSDIIDNIESNDISLRPRRISEFIGQPQVQKNLLTFITAAETRKEAMDHVLLFGPPGLGKTTLAQIISIELGVGFRATSGPIINKAGDLAALLTNLKPKDVLFIDEIHRLSPNIEEILYPAMEDLQLDLIIGEGPSARTIKIDLPPFTLVGATTRSGLLTTPLRDRFGIQIRMEFYNPNDLNDLKNKITKTPFFSLVIRAGSAAYAKKLTKSLIELLNSSSVSEPSETFISLPSLSSARLPCNPDRTFGIAVPTYTRLLDPDVCAGSS